MDLHPATLATLAVLAEERRGDARDDAPPCLTEAIGSLIRSRDDAAKLAEGLLAELEHRPSLRARALDLYDALNRDNANAIITAANDLAILTVDDGIVHTQTAVRLAVVTLCDWVDGEYVP